MINKIILFLNLKNLLNLKIPVWFRSLFIKIKVLDPVPVLNILKVPVPEPVLFSSVPVPATMFNICELMYAY